MAAGEQVAPHVGEFRAGMTFTRYYWQLELDEQLRPTGREIVPGGPPRRAEPRAPRAGAEVAPCARIGRLESDRRGADSPTAARRAERAAAADAERRAAGAGPARLRAGAARQRTLRQLRRAAGRRAGLVPAVRRRRPRQPRRARPSWRSAATILGATAVLVLGAAGAAYAALSKTHATPRPVTHDGRAGDAAAASAGDARHATGDAARRARPDDADDRQTAARHASNRRKSR